MEEPEAWALYELNDEGHWQAHDTINSEPDLAKALQTVRGIIVSKAAKQQTGAHV